MTRRNTLAVAALAAATALVAGPARADYLYHVTLDTSGLIGHVAGPFSLDFQLLDGDGIANNAVTLSSFLFGGGGPSGLPILTGGASGSLPGPIALTDAGFFNAFTQGFAPGTTLTFDVTTTSNLAGGSPDGLSLAILDSSGTELPTLGSSGALLQFDLNGGSPAVQAFGGDPGQSPAGGGAPIPLPPPTANLSGTAPEPGTLALLALAAPAALVRRFRGRRRG